jgi:MFS family permease
VLKILSIGRTIEKSQFFLLICLLSAFNCILIIISGLAVKTGGIATIFIGAIKVVFTLISLSIVDLVGRRVLLLCGSIGMAFSLLALSAAFDQSSQSENMTPTQTVVALVAASGTVAFYSLGFGPVTWLVVSELFPDEIRGRTLGERLFDTVLRT